MGMTLVILNFWWDFIPNARSINGHKFLKAWWNEQWRLCLKDMWFDQQPLSLCMPESPGGKWSEHLQKHLKNQPAHMPWSKNCLSLHSIEANTHTHTRIPHTFLCFLSWREVGNMSRVKTYLVQLWHPITYVISSFWRVFLDGWRRGNAILLKVISKKIRV